jgi:hypothetical protein
LDAGADDFLECVEATIKIVQSYQLDLTSEEHEVLESQLDIRPKIFNRNVMTASLSTTSKHPSYSSGLLVDTDDVVEEVASVPTDTAIQKVLKIDLTAAQQRWELASLVPIALAVLELPKHKALLDALEAAVNDEPNLIAQFVDGKKYPKASEILQLPSGSVRIRYNGSERLLNNPKAAHLIANIRQLRAAQTLPQTT